MSGGNSTAGVDEFGTIRNIRKARSGACSKSQVTALLKFLKCGNEIRLPDAFALSPGSAVVPAARMPVRRRRSRNQAAAFDIFNDRNLFGDRFRIDCRSGIAMHWMSLFMNCGTAAGAKFLLRIRTDMMD
jgi:hypothetical protein